MALSISLHLLVILLSELQPTLHLGLLFGVCGLHLEEHGVVQVVMVVLLGLLHEPLAAADGVVELPPGAPWP